ncbi:DUF1642 domain-containing protein [Lactococcus lactis]|uniref:DUF1642 domain-containing protein n=1 Tax=Lactococcus lactis TaxID=1358 RepID=UPI00071C9CB1|nr:DUF1642 domain-containing protein [Lactococcus lactis]KST90292.1 hypothetical protein LKF24_2037 [Lactococcus lactis subsp. lactis]
MTKFEEELYNKVKVTNIELTTEAEYKKSTLINHFKNWHSDEEFQALLDKYSNLNNNYEKEVIRSSKLESQIIDLKSQLQQQALPVVPELTQKQADILNDYKNGSGSLAKYLSVEIKKRDYDYFARAWLDGYQVEKPQLFYLKNKLTMSYLALDINTGYYEHWGEEIIPKLLNKQGYKTSFTQQEIGSMQTGSYEQIPVPVEEEK